MGGLAKGIAILELFTPDCPELTISVAAERAGLSRAAARRCLLTLVATGHLSMSGNVFTPTPRVLRLALIYGDAGTLPRLARPFLEATRDTLKESVSIAVYVDGCSVIVARAEAEHLVSTGVRLGSRLAAHASATGRVLLAGQPDASVEAYLATAKPVASTPFTIISIEQLRAMIASVRQVGFATTDQEMELGMASIAVPIHGPGGEIAAALSASTHTARLTLDTMTETMLPVLQATASQIEHML